MWQLLILSIIQSVALSAGQMTLKIALERMPVFGWTATFWTSLLTNWWFLLSGILFGSASILWMYILKHFPLSMAYPMVSLSYVFAMIMAIVFLHESVPLNRWIGVGLVMAGCIIVAAK